MAQVPPGNTRFAENRDLNSGIREASLWSDPFVVPTDQIN